LLDLFVRIDKMSDIVVIFSTKNKSVVDKLVILLRNHWEVWWSEDITQGNWRKEVKRQIDKAQAVVPLVSQDTEDKTIFEDELRYADKQNKLIFPFIISEAEMPIGYGTLNRTEAIGWNGEVNHRGYKNLLKKISAEIEETTAGIKRLKMIEVNKKVLKLPCFIFSLSSHETQLHPKNGIQLFLFIKPYATLISAYDIWNNNKIRIPLTMIGNLKKQSECVLFLDSGNYEASRKTNFLSKNNPDGWCRKYFRQIVNDVSPDIAFAYDNQKPQGTVNSVIENTIKNYLSDRNAIRSNNISLVPIVHLPKDYNGTPANCASKIILEVAKELDPIMVAIPERELGNGLIERVKATRDIRRALNSQGK
jgi:hypothetical protein